MAFKQQCPSCEAMVLIKDQAQIGKKIDCPQCKYRFLVESPTGADELAADAAAASAAKAKPDAAKKPAAPAAKGAPAAPAAKGAPAAAPKSAPAAPAAAKGAPAAAVAAKSAPAAGAKDGPAPAAKGTAVPKKEAPSRTNFDDDDDDEPSPKLKGKKSGGGNLVLVAGVGIAIIALGILGIGGFFLLVGDDLGKSSKTGFAVPTNIDMAKGPTTVEDNTPRGNKLVDITNLLPGDADGVYHVNCDVFLRSLVGAALFNSHGAQQHGVIERHTGLKLPDLSELVIGQNLRQGWLFAVVRGSKELEVAAITKNLGLKPAPGGPIKNQEYFVTEPSAWLDNMVRLLTDFGGGERKPAEPPKPRAFAVRFIDKQTLVVADPEPMKAFLESGGNPPPAPKSDAKLTTKPSSHYLAVKAPLKAVLDRVETKSSVFLSVAWDMTAFKDPLGRSLRLLADLNLVDPKAVAQVDDMKAIGLSLQMQENSVFTLCVDGRREGQGKELRTELRSVGEAIARSGSTVEFDSQVIKPPPPPPGTPPLPPRPSFFIKTFPEEKPPAFTVEVQQPRPGGNAMLLNELLKPQMLILSGIIDMAREQPGVLTELSRALVDYSTDNKGFPLGTADRKSSFGRPLPPGERVSWMVELLPQLGRDDVYKAINPLESWRPEWNPATRRWLDTNARLGSVLIPGFLDPTAAPQTWWVQMPSMPMRRFGATHFVGMAGVGLDAAEYRANDAAEAKKLGVFGYYRQTKLDDIKDGLANTIVTVQVPPNYKRPWIAGGGATVMGVPERYSIAPFVCVKRGDRLGTHVLMADGSVRFVAKEVPDEVFKAMCTINGGEKVDLDANSTLVSPARK